MIAPVNLHGDLVLKMCYMDSTIMMYLMYDYGTLMDVKGKEM
jgi:hypothetical protein